MTTTFINPEPETVKLKDPTLIIIKAGDPKGRSGINTLGKLMVLVPVSVDIAHKRYLGSMVKLPVRLTLVAPPKYSAAVNILEVVK